ncbi:MAG: CpaF family protein [Acidimicrobiales bacterium]
MSAAAPLGEAKARVHARLLAEEAATGAIPERVAALVEEEAPLLGGALRRRLVAGVLADVCGLGALEPLLADPEITEVMVNGPGRVWVERRGALVRVPVDLDTAAIEHLIEKVVAPLGLRVDRSSPLVDARLPDGSRVNAVVPPLAVDGPCLTVRRFGARAVPLGAFAAPEMADLLAEAVRRRRNIVVSGGTGAGKTTLLNALAACIPPEERVITVEDAAELNLARDHVVRLEARPANAEGAGEVRIRDLVRNALRMRPDRIVVGEVRGPEALDMLQAMNTGHEGSLSTCHANSPDDALRRLETMVLMGEVQLPLAAVRSQLEAALDLVVQVARFPDGSRRITAVAEVVEGAGATEGAGRTRPVCIPRRDPGPDGADHDAACSRPAGAGRP